MVTEKGKKVREGWIKLSEKYNIPISYSAIPAVSSFKIKCKDSLKYKTFITQEMLKKDFIASTHFYACTEHEDKFIDDYFNELDKIFHIISKCETKEFNIDNLLEGPVCHAGFSRLN